MQLQKRRWRTARAFNLIELTVVALVVTTLSATATATFQAQQTRTEARSAEATLRSVENLAVQLAVEAGTQVHTQLPVALAKADLTLPDDADLSVITVADINNKPQVADGGGDVIDEANLLSFTRVDETDCKILYPTSVSVEGEILDATNCNNLGSVELTQTPTPVPATRRPIAAPAAPGQPTAANTVGTQQLDLSLLAKDYGDVANEDGYRYYVRKTVNDPWILSGTSGEGTVQFEITGLDVGSYFVGVSAFNRGGESAITSSGPSATAVKKGSAKDVSERTQARPRVVSVIQGTDGLVVRTDTSAFRRADKLRVLRVECNETASPDPCDGPSPGDTNADKTYLQDTNSGATVLTVLDATTRSFVDASAQPGVEYGYAIDVYTNEAPNSYSYHSEVKKATFTPEAGTASSLQPPRGFAVAPGDSATSHKFSWEAPANAPDEILYHLQVSHNADGPPNDAHIRISATSYEADNAAQGRVRSWLDIDGDRTLNEAVDIVSAWSPTIRVSTSGVDASTPSAPTLQTPATDGGRVTLAWGYPSGGDSSTRYGAADVKRFEIRRDGRLIGSAAPKADAVTWIDTNPSTTKAATYTVRAILKDGRTSLEAESVSTRVPKAPTDLKLERIVPGAGSGEFDVVISANFSEGTPKFSTSSVDGTTCVAPGGDWESVGEGTWEWTATVSCSNGETARFEAWTQLGGVDSERVPIDYVLRYSIPPVQAQRVGTDQVRFTIDHLQQAPPKGATHYLTTWAPPGLDGGCEQGVTYMDTNETPHVVGALNAERVFESDASATNVCVKVEMQTRGSGGSVIGETTEQEIQYIFVGNS